MLPHEIRQESRYSQADVRMDPENSSKDRRRFLSLERELACAGRRWRRGRSRDYGWPAFGLFTARRGNRGKGPIDQSGHILRRSAIPLFRSP